MTVKIISENEEFIGVGARAEQRVFNFLKQLPDGYLLREPRIVPSNDEKAHGSTENKPDFIVIHPQIGVVVLEVKHWDIYGNHYEFPNLWKIRIIDRNGNNKEVENPYNQAKRYLEALIKIRPIVSNSIWVSSFVVHPYISRAEFENRMAEYQKDNAQQRFIFDPAKTLFSDDLDRYRDNALGLLQRYVENDRRIHNKPAAVSFTEQQVDAIASYLVPSQLRVGGLPDDSKSFQTLDKKQREWACSDELKDKTYLLDVAGSGKTNILLSRAIHLAEEHLTSGGCLILVVTYSKALKLELERIFHTKFDGSIDHDNGFHDYCRDAIRIYDMVSLMEEIIKECIGERNFATWQNVALSSYTELEYTDKLLPEKCLDLLNKYPARFRMYDYLFIDEIQDFSTWFMWVTLNLLKDLNNIFTVGDAGQKLFDRELDWGVFDIVRERVEVRSRYLMYRSPRPIAKLAWEFLTSDSGIKQNLEDEGYKTDITPKSPRREKPIFIASDNEEMLLERVCDDMQKLLYDANPEQILCVGMKNGLLGQLHQRLGQDRKDVRWATEANEGDYILLADYLDAKGLERDYVLIVDADDLAKPSSFSASLTDVRKSKRRDRIKLFVALTRAMREVRLYYINHQHTFIRELLQIQSTREDSPWKSM